MKIDIKGIYLQTFLSRSYLLANRIKSTRLPPFVNFAQKNNFVK